MGQCVDCNCKTNSQTTHQTPQLDCGICKEKICKPCAHFVDEENFLFMEPFPKELAHGVYCHDCFTTHVQGRLADYENQLALAKEVFIFNKGEGKETRLIKRTEAPLSVQPCRDRNEALLRLAFQAAGKHFNALVDVDIRGEKVRDGTYQTTVYHAKGIPAQVDSEKHNRDKHFKLK